MNGEYHTPRIPENYVAELLKRRKISVSKAAELLDSSVHRVHELTRERGVETGATSDQNEAAERTARKLT